MLFSNGRRKRMTQKLSCFKRKEWQVFCSVTMASLGKGNPLGRWQLWDEAEGVMKQRANRKVNICKDNTRQEEGCYGVGAGGQSYGWSVAKG